MTAIAYKDGLMASDEFSGMDDLVDYCPEKGWLKNGYMIGMSGKDCPPAALVNDWLFAKSKKIGKLKPFTPKAKFQLLVVSPQKKLCTIDERGFIEPIYTKFWAIGIGGHVCMGAMAAGKSAKEAVNIAIKYVDACRGTARTIKQK